LAAFIQHDPQIAYKGVEKQASGRQPRRAAFWKAQHIKRYVSIYKSRTTPDHGLRRGFSTALLRRL
jgi:hypothetical protein